MVDKYGQIVTINRGSQINFKLNKPEVDTAAFATEILGVTDFFSAFGTYNMSGMGLLTAPGNEIIVTLSVYGVDFDVPSNRDYLAEMLAAEGVSSDGLVLPEEYRLTLEMRVRNCLLGEGLRETGACYVCP